MRLVSFAVEGRSSWGAVVDGGVVDLGRRFAGEGLVTLRRFLEAGDMAAARTIVEGAAADFPLAAVTLLPVIPDPDKIVCVGMNYRDHVAETGRAVTEHPSLFARYAGSQVGPGAAMIRPKVSEQFDFEGELAVIIGKACRHVAEADALSVVAGYACYNDGSVRDWQRHTTQFLPGKTFAGTGAFGPWMVTADEIPDPSVLTLETRLNGVVVQHTTTDLMIATIPQVIAYMSTVLPLLPGDVIVSGTPGGIGAKRTPPLWMKPGDTVEVEISKIGVLANPIADEAA